MVWDVEDDDLDGKEGGLNGDYDYKDVDGYRIPFYKRFSKDSIAEVMSLAKRKGRVPMSVADIAERRLYSEMRDWRCSWFHTGDAIFYSINPDKFKVVRNASVLRDITPKSKIVGGKYNKTLVISREEYKGAEGPEFSRRDLQSILGRDLALDEVKNHPVWQALFDNQSLLDEYANRAFNEAREEFHEARAMRIALRKAELRLRPFAVSTYLDGLSADWDSSPSRFSSIILGTNFIGQLPEARLRQVA